MLCKDNACCANIIFMLRIDNMHAVFKDMLY